MKRSKIMVALLLMILLATLPMMSIAEDAYGSAAVTTNQTYTLEQMLTYAIQDEYMAQAEYQGILTTLGGDAPFSNILRAEATHIALLETLFATYKITVPANTAATKVTIPATLEEAYAIGVQAENANIAMYNTFLAQADLPEDVQSVFTELYNGSQNHLTAFSRNTAKSGLGQGMMNGRQNNTTTDAYGKNSKKGMMENRTTDETWTCPLGEDCLALTDVDGQQSYSRGNGNNCHR